MQQEDLLTPTFEGTFKNGWKEFLRKFQSDAYNTQERCDAACFAAGEICGTPRSRAALLGAPMEYLLLHDPQRDTETFALLTRRDTNYKVPGRPHIESIMWVPQHVSRVGYTSFEHTCNVRSSRWTGNTEGTEHHTKWVLFWSSLVVLLQSDRVRLSDVSGKALGSGPTKNRRMSCIIRMSRGSLREPVHFGDPIEVVPAFTQH